MKEVLFLVHRLPFPPDKGDKIRSYYLLRFLAERYKVHLGCFIDDPRDEQYRSQVESMCSRSKICRLQPIRARARSSRALLTGEPLSWPYYRDSDLQKWVETTIRYHGVSSIVCFSSPMSQYVMADGFRGRRIMDFVDVDSDKWRQYAKRSRWPMRWVYAREASHLVKYEREVARKFDASIFVTQNEVELFDELAPDSRGKHFSVPNGVASEYFDPAKEFERPFGERAKAIVFTGMMDYWANVDAVAWFAKQVLPAIRKVDNTAEFWIVGASPTEDVKALETVEGVKVTGRVADVRPYLKHAHVVVAPLRIARGIQNKVLEALAMGCRIICTTHAATGLHELGEAPIAVADDSNEFAAAVMREFDAGNGAERKVSARQYVLENYCWANSLKEFERIHNGVKQCSM